MISLGDATRAYMRRAAESLMTDTCTIERLASTTGQMGEQINAWAVMQTGVKCRMISESARSNNQPLTVAEQKVLPERYRLVLPAGTTIYTDARFTLASDSSVWLVGGVVRSHTDEVDTQVIVIPEAP